MLTFAMPQSVPAADRNVSASRTSVVKMHDDKPLRHVVLHRDRLVERVVLHHVQDRREGLFAHDRASAPASRRSRDCT